MRSDAIVLSGAYKDLDSRDYVILQDDLERVHHLDSYVAHVRVMRQGHPYVQCGTIRIPARLCRDLAAAEADRSRAVSQALIVWLQHQSMKLRFALRASAVCETSGAFHVHFEEAPMCST